MDEGFAPGIGEKLRSYVYLLVDPRTGRAFFVGRGRNDRCFRHLQAARSVGQRFDADEPNRPGRGAPGGAGAPGGESTGGTGAPGDESIGSPSQPGGRSFPLLDRIRELESGGRSVRIDILRYGLSADEARLVEAVARDALGLHSDPGSRSERAGGSGRVGRDGPAGGAPRGRQVFSAQRTEATALNTLLAKPAKIKRNHRVVLLRLGKAFGPGTSDAQLDEAIRSGWKIGRRWTDPQDRRSPQWALAVVDDVVRAVYRIDGWKQAEPPVSAVPAEPAVTAVPAEPAVTAEPAAGASPTSPAETTASPLPARWALTGERDPELERKYRGRNVSAYLSSGSQNPVTYVWCGPHWVNSPG